MNAVNISEDSTPAPETSLAAARERLAETAAREAEAAAKLEAIGAARERGRQAHEVAVSEDSRLEAAESEWIERDARRLQTAYAEGSRMPPALVADPKAQQARLSARINVRARALALEHLILEEQAARQEHAAAKSEHRAAADAIIDIERESSAAKVLHHEAELLREGAVLHGYVPDDRHVPLNRLPGHQLSISARVQRALDVLKRVEAPTLKDDLNKPMSELQRIGPVPSELLAERRAALTDGAAPDPAAEPRDAAA
jgi:hypothetical protein